MRSLDSRIVVSSQVAESRQHGLASDAFSCAAVWTMQSGSLEPAEIGAILALWRYPLQQAIVRAVPGRKGELNL